MKILNFFFVFLFCLFSFNLSAEIFYVDMDKIINQTNVGKYINKKFENEKKKKKKKKKKNKKKKINKNKKKKLKKKKKKNNTKNIERKKLLKKREENLIAQKNILEANEFNSRLNLFKKDVSNFNQLSKKSNQDLQNNLIKNKTNFLKLIEPILLEYVAANNITYLLQKKYIIVGHNDLNKTMEIIELLDKQITISNFNDSISQ